MNNLQHQARLIVMAGLPGTGKSAIAERLSIALRAPILSVDPVESAMLASGLSKTKTGIAAYAVAQALAAENLSRGLTVIVDAVNPVEAARQMWRDTAEKRSVPLIFVEVVCSDTKIHRTRLERRVRNIPGIPEVTWADVEKRRNEYTPWTTPRILLDTAVSDSDILVSNILKQMPRTH